MFVFIHNPMNKFFISVWRLWLYWLVFFAIFRILFILAQPHQWWENGVWEIAQSLWHALPLDLSTIGYLTLVPVIVRFVGIVFSFDKRQYVEKGIDFYNYGVIAFTTGICSANIALYPEWGTLLNYRAFQYIRQSPEALFDSISFGFGLLLVASMALLIWFFVRLYQKMTRGIWYNKRVSFGELAALPIHLIVLGLGIRGGMGVMPINESVAYYSVRLFNNHAATNIFWHLVHSVLEVKSARHHYEYMPEEAARQKTQALLSAALPYPTQWLSPAVPRPNVVLVIMESMTAQVIGHLGGPKDLCPNLDSLAASGIRFDSCYSSGFRTDQGLVCALSGYPAQPDQSIMLLTEKSERLPGLSGFFREKGYKTAFYHGSGLTFANMGLWLRSQGFETIVSESDFAGAEVTQRWGVDDKTMLNRFCRDLGALPQPFFATALTLSLHSPFDVPHESRWNGPDESDQFLHSANFTDEAIGQFMAAAAQMPWYANTIFVFVADHGALLPRRVGNDHPLARHIPLIITGPPLAAPVRGTHIRSVCNHHDIPSTILGLIPFGTNTKMDSTTSNAKAMFPWSRNMLNYPAQTPGFAYFSNESGLGWIAGRRSGFYSFGDNTWFSHGDSLHTAEQEQAKAYLQTLYADFLKR
jgi:phosphoglycerol transferase MdoB-like AlkP superfamily enzyme